MTRYVIDAGTAIRLARDGVAIPDEHQLLAPTLIRSQALSLLHSAVGRGELERRDAELLLTRIRALRLRLLGDRVLQSVAWKIADELGDSDTFDAEYIALTTLQADAIIAADDDLAARARNIVEVASIRVLYPEGRQDGD